jgi:nitrate reductase gamma subunit
MRAHIDTAKRILREFIEFGFLILLALILIHLILGPSSGSYVTQVADNVAKFVAAITAPGLIGIAIILTLVYLIAPRWRDTDDRRASR